MEKNSAQITKDGVIFSTTNHLDPDVHFWRDVFVPLTSTLVSRQKNNDKTCVLTLDALPPSNNGVGYLQGLSILVGIAAGIAIVIYFIRNRKKPYVWKP
jgi:hypothetical protein